MNAAAGEIAALALAGIAMAGLVAWPLMRARRGMLLVQFVAVASLSGHYAVSGLATAALVNGLGAAQIAGALAFGERPRMRWIAQAMVPVVVAATFMTWQGLPSLLAAMGTVLTSLGRVQIRAERMRLLVLASGPFWLAHDLIVWSPVALVDAAAICTGLYAVLADGRPKPALQPA